MTIRLPAGGYPSYQPPKTPLPTVQQPPQSNDGKAQPKPSLSTTEVPPSFDDNLQFERIFHHPHTSAYHLHAELTQSPPKGLYVDRFV